MSARHVYLVVDLCDTDEHPLKVRRLVEEALQRLFGEIGGATVQVDVLKAGDGRALLRTPATHSCRLRAALALANAPRLLKYASSLQALL